MYDYPGWGQEGGGFSKRCHSQCGDESLSAHPASIIWLELVNEASAVHRQYTGYVQNTFGNGRRTDTYHFPAKLCVLKAPTGIENS
jgi:hypothetical protein